MSPWDIFFCSRRAFNFSPITIQILRAKPLTAGGRAPNADCLIQSITIFDFRLTAVSSSGRIVSWIIPRVGGKCFDLRWLHAGKVPDFIRNGTRYHDSVPEIALPSAEIMRHKRDGTKSWVR